MPDVDLSRATWHKSTRSNGQGDCVEAAENADIVGVRDSKDRTGPMLVFGHAGWRAFLAAVKDGEFDL